MPSKSNIDQYRKEPFEGFYEIAFKYLQSYHLIKAYNTDGQLFGGARKSFAGIFPSYSKNHTTFAKGHKVNWNIYNVTASEFFYITKDKKTELLSFLFHLRNAIAHGTICYDGTSFEIIDYPYNRSTGKMSKTKSAHCRVQALNLKSFFEQLICLLP